MIDGNVSEFIDKITFQEEAVLYQGEKYFFHGLIFDSVKGVYTFEIHLWDEHGNYVDTVYSCKADTQSECMGKLLNDPIIDGKCFWEIEQQMTWVEW